MESAAPTAHIAIPISADRRVEVELPHNARGTCWRSRYVRLCSVVALTQCAARHRVLSTVVHGIVAQIVLSDMTDNGVNVDVIVIL